MSEGNERGEGGCLPCAFQSPSGVSKQTEFDGNCFPLDLCFLRRQMAPVPFAVVATIHLVLQKSPHLAGCAQIGNEERRETRLGKIPRNSFFWGRGRGARVNGLAFIAADIRRSRGAKEKQQSGLLDEVQCQL